MILRVAVLMVMFGAVATLSYAQTTPPPARKATAADANKVLQGIAADKARLQIYCDVAKLNQQMSQAEEKKDAAAVQELAAKADRLEETLGSDYAELMIRLEQVDPDSDEGKQIADAFADADKKCTTP